MRPALGALLALPAALRVACLEVVDSGEPALNGEVPSNTNLQAGVDQAFIADICPDYTNYAKVKQYVRRHIVFCRC